MPINEVIIKIGRTRTVMAIAAISVLLSLSLTLVLVLVLRQFGVNMDVGGSILISVVVPSFVAPSVTWYVVGLLIKVNQLEEKMRELATYDSLTGLLNRRSFMEQTKHLFSITKRHEQAFSFILIDVDNLKEINDQYGHMAGDKVLISFGHLLDTLTRESDLVGRIGGDEFVIFLPNTADDQAMRFSERLHSAVRGETICSAGLTIQYTISMGLISYPKTTPNDLEELLSHVDKALYSAKAIGRNQTVAFNSKFESYGY